MTYTTNQTPNLRLNAIRLGVRLLCSAANPWSGLDRLASRKAPWQPVHPFGMPKWWPYPHVKGDRVVLDQIALMQSGLQTENGVRHHGE